MMKGEDADFIFDEMTTLFSLAAYATWLGLEAGEAEGLERLTTLVIWCQSRRTFQSCNLDPNTVCHGLLLLLSAEECSWTREGAPLVCDSFVEATKPDFLMRLVSILLNVVAGSSTDTLKSISGFDKIIVALEMHLVREGDALFDVHCLVVYLFLFRAHKSFRLAPLAMNAVMRVVRLRSSLPEECEELWYLAVLALCDCVEYGGDLRAWTAVVEKMDDGGEREVVEKLRGRLAASRA